MQDTNFPNFTRETYKTVKKMDREQMETFFRNVYDLGKNSNHEAVVDFSELRKRLSEIKGIGEKRLRAARGIDRDRVGRPAIAAFHRGGGEEPEGFEGLHRLNEGVIAEARGRHHLVGGIDHPLLLGESVKG